MKPRLVVTGPLPPPSHGVSISTELILRNPRLAAEFEVEHFDTSDRRSVANVGRWDVRNVLAALSALARLAFRLRGRRGVFYLPISQGIPGLARDTLFIRMASAMGWKVAVHLRGSELGGVYRQQPRLVKAWLRRAFDRIDSFAVLGASVQGVLDGVVRTTRVVVVPNGTPDPGTSDNGARPATGLFLGNMFDRKGPREAMEAAVLVCRRRPDVRFVFAGECPDPDFEQELRDLARLADGRIEIRPGVYGADKDRLLLDSAFLLFPPARQEGHPRVVLEAIAAGLPVVTTDRGVIAETVIDRESGYVLPNPVPEELAGAMLELLEDDELRQRMGRVARSHYLEHFTQEASDEATARWLTEVAAGS